MCGIFLVHSKQQPLSLKKCRNAFKTLHNRGPDVSLESIFLKESLFIGNSILKITGKTDKKKKLFSYKKNHISYNGEIYNYLKLSKKYLHKIEDNDTLTLLKVITNQKPIKILKELDGMYASVIYNSIKKKIFYATDPQGEKKLYKYEDDRFLILSSNVKSIATFFDFKLKINYDNIQNYFYSRHFTQFEQTIFSKINYVKGGIFYEYALENKKTKYKTFDNPLNWINKKNYFLNRDKSFIKIVKNLDKKLNKKLKLMTPKINFGTIFSGGIDSSIITSILQSNKYHKKSICIYNQNKDIPALAVLNKKFLKYIDYSKLDIIKFTKKKYFNLIPETYSNFFNPLSTHDLPGRQKIFEYFKKNKIKVIFGGDGADEIFGGYLKYKKVFNKVNKIKIISPYSKIDKENSLSKKIDNLFHKAFKKYNSFLSKKESIVQANLFVDYFFQSVSVHNISNDILCGENSIEMRSVFLNKEIIKFALNLPLKFKINLNYKKIKFLNKPVLHQIFQNRFDKSLIFKKQGFSGFPNEIIELLNKKDKKELKKFILLKKASTKNNKEIVWKYLNIFLHNKYNNRLKIKFNNSLMKYKLI